MKKVLVLTNSINGLYNFRRELIYELIKKKYRIIISAPPDNRKEYFGNIGCKLIDTQINSRGTNPFIDIKLFMRYFKMINSYKPNVVLTYTIKPNIYGGIVCRILKIPYIANITGLGSAVENGGLLQKITTLLYRLSLKDASCVFFQNEENRTFMINKGIAINNNKLIPGSGVNLNYFKLLDYPNGNKIRFLFIARIIKEKGIDYYLEAAEHIKKKYPNTEFHILGNCDDDYIEVLKLMHEKGIIKYHGRQDDVREFHKISHCTIHPTYYPEGMSNVLLESAACGRPIITTNRAGCRDIVDNEINGYIVEEKNAKDLIEKIEKFLSLKDEEKRKMGLEGRKKVEREFDRNIVIKTYLQEIERVS